MIDCTSIDLADGPLRAWLLHLARRHTPPLHLRVTPAQLVSLGAEVIDGIAYLGDVPATTTEQVPPPRPVPPVVIVPPPVDLAVAKAARIDENSVMLWEHVNQHINARERESLIATQLTVLDFRVKGTAVNPEAAALLSGMLVWISTCMVTQVMLSASVSLASTPEAVAVLVPNLSIIAPPQIKTAGEITFMLYAGG